MCAFSWKNKGRTQIVDLQIIADNKKGISEDSQHQFKSTKQKVCVSSNSNKSIRNNSLTLNRLKNSKKKTTEF